MELLFQGNLSSFLFTVVKDKFSEILVNPTFLCLLHWCLHKIAHNLLWKWLSVDCANFEFVIDPFSYTYNLRSCEFKAWKKFRPELDWSPWPFRYQCSALLNVLSKHLGAGHLIFGKKVKEAIESYIWIAEKDMNLWLIITVIHTT